MRPVLTFLILVLALSLPFSIDAQNTSDAMEEDAKARTNRRKVISSIHAFASWGLFTPDDHGYSDYVRQSRDGAAAHEFHSRHGLQYGIGVSHFFKQFEIAVRVSRESKGFKSNFHASHAAGTYGSTIDFKSSYTSVYLIPSYRLKSGFRFLIGSFYSHLMDTRALARQYRDGVLVNQGTFRPVIEDFEIGVSGGLGFRRNVVDRWSIEFSVQGNWGLSDIMNDNGLRITTNSLMLMIIVTRDRY